jgi:hypothetical protein
MQKLTALTEIAEPEIDMKKEKNEPLRRRKVRDEKRAQELWELPELPKK